MDLHNMCEKNVSVKKKKAGEMIKGTESVNERIKIM